MRDAYHALAALLAAKLAHVARRGAMAPEHVEPLSWAIVGTLSLHLTRWAVFEEITATELARVLRAAAHTLMPRNTIRTG